MSETGLNGPDGKCVEDGTIEGARWCKTHERAFQHCFEESERASLDAVTRERDELRAVVEAVRGVANDLSGRDGALIAVDCGSDVNDIFGSSERHQIALRESEIAQRINAALAAKPQPETDSR